MVGKLAYEKEMRKKDTGKGDFIKELKEYKDFLDTQDQLIQEGGSHAYENAYVNAVEMFYRKFGKYLKTEK